MIISNLASVAVVFVVCLLQSACLLNVALTKMYSFKNNFVSIAFLLTPLPSCTCTHSLSCPRLLASHTLRRQVSSTVINAGLGA